MRIIKIIPVRVTHSKKGLVDIVYEKRYGFLWLRRRVVTRRAASTTGILWSWLDKPNDYLHYATKIIEATVLEL